MRWKLLRTQREAQKRIPDIVLWMWCRECIIFFKRQLFSLIYTLSYRQFSSKANTAENLGKVKYENADTQKEKIYKDNRGKTGVYRWTNLLNGNTYVGSSTNLAKRFALYYSLTYLQKQAKKNSIISRALLKYGHSALRAV